MTLIRASLNRLILLVAVATRLTSSREIRLNRWMILWSLRDHRIFKVLINVYEGKNATSSICIFPNPSPTVLSWPLATVNSERVDQSWHHLPLLHVSIS